MTLRRWYLASMLAVLAVLHWCEHHLWFRDFSIIWEGAHRLLLGQRPYVDFGLPMGPGSLVVPWLSFAVFGPSSLGMTVSALVVAAVALISWAKILENGGVTRFPWYAGVGLFLLHLVQLKHPWYNSSALAIELVAIACAMALRRPSKRLDPLHAGGAGAATVACILTKQDYAAPGLVIVLSLVVLVALERRRPMLLAWFAGGIAVAVGVAMAWLYTPEFTYWFNYGQAPHNPRTERLSLNGWSAWPLTYGLPCARFALLGSMLATALGVLLARKRKEALWSWLALGGVCVGLVGQSTFTLITSGLQWATGNYYVAPFLVLVLHFVWQAMDGQSTRAHVVRWGTAYFLIAFWQVTPGPSPTYQLTDFFAGRVVQTYGEGPARPYVRGDLAGFPTVGREWLPVETVDGLQKIKSLIPQPAGPCAVLNMTELTFLASEFRFEPCPGEPLWYNIGTVLFPREYDRLVADFTARRFRVVLIQWTHEDNLAPPYAHLIATLDQHYKKAAEFPAPRPGAPIMVYTAAP